MLRKPGGQSVSKKCKKQPKGGSARTQCPVSLTVDPSNLFDLFNIFFRNIRKKGKKGRKKQTLDDLTSLTLITFLTEMSKGCE